MSNSFLLPITNVKTGSDDWKGVEERGEEGGRRGGKISKQSVLGSGRGFKRDEVRKW